MTHHGYPLPRAERGRAAALHTPAAYGRAESSAATTCGDTDATIITFSGQPDQVELVARAFSAIFTLYDRLGRSISEMLVNPGDVHEENLRCDRVDARNAVAGSNAVVMVVGKWADPSEATHGFP